MSYEGWKNWETFNLAVLIANTEPLYDYWREKTETIVDEQEEHYRPYEIAQDLGKILDEWLYNPLCMTERAGVQYSYLRMSYQETDCQEIALSWIESLIQERKAE